MTRNPPRLPGSDLPRPLFARFYTALVSRMEEGGLAALREELLSPLAGRVVEVGCGTGANFEHYPSSVVDVHAVEPEPHLRQLARAASKVAPVPITVTPGTGSALPLEDGSVDAAVLCMVLCSVPEPESAIAELMRVLRPGGQLVFLEHHLSHSPGVRRLQKVADATLWPRVAGGCHLSRDPVETIRRGGFTIETVRSPEQTGRLAESVAPHVLGRASRP